MAEKGYSVTNQVTRENGNVHGHIMHMGPVEFSIPEDAERRPGKDGEYWNWTATLKGGARINLQAYGECRPGDTATFHVELREKKLAHERGGYRFLYAKLTQTNEAATQQFVVADGGYLQKVEELRNRHITVLWCPQQKHFGGMVFAPLAVPLPQQRGKSQKLQRRKAKPASA